MTSLAAVCTPFEVKPYVSPLVVPFKSIPNPTYSFLHQSICIVLGIHFRKAEVFTSCHTWHGCLKARCNVRQVTPATGPKSPFYGRCGQGSSWASSVCVVGRWQLWCLWSSCYEWNDDKIRSKKADARAVWCCCGWYVHMDISLKNISWIHMTSVFAVNCEEISPEAGWTSQDPIILMGCIWHLPRFCYLVDHIQGSKTKASASEGNGWNASELIRKVTSPEWTP